MHTPTARPATARNPVARSLALAVLSLALAGLVIVGGVAFAVLAALFGIGYSISRVHQAICTGQSRARMRQRAFTEQPPAADAVIAEAGH